MLTLHFPDTSYEAWISQLEKDLKGKPWTDLQWQLGDGIVVDPFYHPDNYQPQRSPLTDQRSHNHWEIGETIEVSAPKMANQELLEALEGGAEALELRLNQPLALPDLSALLHEVQLEYISLHLVEVYTEKKPLALLKALKVHALSQGFDPAKLRGSIRFTVDQMLALAETIRWVLDELPVFKVSVIPGRDIHHGPEHSASELAAVIQEGSTVLGHLQDLGIAPRDCAPLLQLSIAISTSYFVEIAKLRALRILWHNVLKAYEVPDSSVEIVAHFAPGSQDENANTNLIRAATQAMSAVIGGANILYVLPSNAGQRQTPTLFTKRIARNVQHLLRMESHLDKVMDPAAGSYYVEKLSEELAKKAWAIFQ